MGLFHSFSYDILQNEPEKPQLSPPGNRRAQLCAKTAGKSLARQRQGVYNISCMCADLPRADSNGRAAPAGR